MKRRNVLLFGVLPLSGCISQVSEMVDLNRSGDNKDYNMPVHVDIKLSDNALVKMDAETVSGPSEKSPIVIRLELENRTSDELKIESGEPAPLGNNRSKEGPEHLEFQPTEETIDEHNLRGDSTRYQRGKIEGEPEECWVVDDGYGPARQIAVPTVIGPENRLVFEYAFVTIPSAKKCYPKGVYLFNDSISFIENGKSVNEIDWKLELEIVH